MRESRSNHRSVAGEYAACSLSASVAGRCSTKVPNADAMTTSNSNMMPVRRFESVLKSRFGIDAMSETMVLLRATEQSHVVSQTPTTPLSH